MLSSMFSLPATSREESHSSQVYLCSAWYLHMCFESHLDAHSVFQYSLFMIHVHCILDHYSMVCTVHSILLHSLCFVSPAYWLLHCPSVYWSLCWPAYSNVLRFHSLELLCIRNIPHWRQTSLNSSIISMFAYCKIALDYQAFSWLLYWKAMM